MRYILTVFLLFMLVGCSNNKPIIVSPETNSRIESSEVIKEDSVNIIVANTSENHTIIEAKQEDIIISKVKDKVIVDVPIRLMTPAATEKSDMTKTIGTVIWVIAVLGMLFYLKKAFDQKS